MGVYIKGMEMPKCCAECKAEGHYEDYYGDEYGFFCPFGYKAYTSETRELKRLDDCPLVPVPPHGRLIDADALRAKQQEDADLFQGSTAYGDKCRRDEAMNAVANIVNAPTIIPASFENPTKNARYSQDNPAEEGE